MGISYYDVKIPLVPSTYGKVKKNGSLEEYQSSILEALKDANGKDGTDFSEVSFYASVKEDDLDSSAELGDISIYREPSFWTNGYYKLFISHVSSNKDSAIWLKNILSQYGVSCFVAHEDIKPTKEWQSEIESALRTMDGLCAIYSKDFHDSDWCDQELGHALGRNVIIIPLIKDCLPYGFAGKIQGIKAKGMTVSHVAEEIFKILSSNEITYQRIIGNLLLNAKNDEDAKHWLDLLSKMDGIDFGVLSYIKDKFSDNKILSSGLADANELFAKYGIKPVIMQVATQVIDSKDDLPF